MNNVPPYHTLMLPLLKVMGTRNEMTTKQMRDEVAAIDLRLLRAKTLSEDPMGGRIMSMEWLITLEGLTYDDASDDAFYIWREWATLKYQKLGESEYTCEIVFKNRDGSLTTKKVIRFPSNSDLVKAVLGNVREQYRVKELPCKYGEWWRKIFRKNSINNWANETPSPNL